MENQLVSIKVEVKGGGGSVERRVSQTDTSLRKEEKKKKIRLISAGAPNHRSDDQVDGANKHSQGFSLAYSVQISQSEILHNVNGCH